MAGQSTPHTVGQSARRAQDDAATGFVFDIYSFSLILFFVLSFFFVFFFLLIIGVDCCMFASLFEPAQVAREV